MAVTDLTPSYSHGLWILSLTLIVVSACMRAKGPRPSDLLTVFKVSAKRLTVHSQSRHPQTLIFRPRQIPRSEAMGSDTPTLCDLAPERKFSTGHSSNPRGVWRRSPRSTKRGLVCYPRRLARRPHDSVLPKTFPQEPIMVPASTGASLFTANHAQLYGPCSYAGSVEGSLYRKGAARSRKRHSILCRFAYLKPPWQGVLRCLCQYGGLVQLYDLRHRWGPWVWRALWLPRKQRLSSLGFHDFRLPQSLCARGRNSILPSSWNRSDETGPEESKRERAGSPSAVGWQGPSTAQFGETTARLHDPRHRAEYRHANHEPGGDWVDILPTGCRRKRNHRHGSFGDHQPSHPEPFRDAKSRFGDPRRVQSGERYHDGVS